MPIHQARTGDDTPLMPEVNSPILWSPSRDRIADSNVRHFALKVGIDADPLSQRAEVAYEKLHRWSIEYPAPFWRGVWDFSELQGSLGERDGNRSDRIWEHRFFPDGELNYAQNVLQPNRLSDPKFSASIATIAVDETGHEDVVTRRALYDQVVSIANYFQSLGIGRGDRIAAVLPNRIEAVIGLLAASALGAIWTSCSPDFGDDALFDRFGQIEPLLLIYATHAQYNGKRLELESRMESLIQRLPTLKHRIAVGSPSFRGEGFSGTSVSWSDVLAQSPTQSEDCFDCPFPPLPFHHPLYILYSSGTTGAPKCILHSAGGSLLQHAKEHRLHVDLKPGDRLFYYTTTGWMMWNWLVSALASDAAIVLYDGSPLTPDAGVLWRLAERHGVTHFGASARYYAALEKQSYVPKDHVQLPRLRSILSTGSPLLPEQFHWIYDTVGTDLHLASISGGTDIVSCFVLGNPTLPVHAGEIQCPGLGMDVAVFDEDGNERIGQAGELVCRNAFPSMPIGFWNDPENQRYRSTYFERFANTWWHGDWSLQSENGGFTIYGRSDATLNPGGVRIGTAEIYRQIETIPEVAEAVATALRQDGDERIVLFVKLRGDAQWSDGLVASMKDRLRHHCSPRHVPAWVVEAPDLPRTISGKLSEIAVRNAISGQSIGNAGALANPESLSFFQRWRETIISR